MADRGFWGDKWKEGHTPWDLGREHPGLHESLLLASDLGGLEKGARILVPGCGRGHEAYFLARQGYEVLAEDYTDEAIVAARGLGGHKNVEFRVADSLEEPASEDHGVFDAVVDRAMLCAINPEERNKYLDACYTKLRPSGLFIGLLFGEVSVEKGPPHGMDLEAVLHLCGEQFSLLTAEHRDPLDEQTSIKSELLIILSKRM